MNNMLDLTGGLNWRLSTHRCPVRSRKLSAAKKYRTAYGALNGIQGVLAGTIIDLRSQFFPAGGFSILECTPAMALGSCRFRLPEEDADPALYQKIDEGFLSTIKSATFSISAAITQWIPWMPVLVILNALTGYQKSSAFLRPLDNDLPGSDHSPDSVLRPNLSPPPCWKSFGTVTCMTPIR